MNKIRIKLSDFEKVLEFIKVADTLNCNMKLISGTYVVDGNSILGILALDLTKAIEVCITNEMQDLNYCPKELETFMI